jgi:hypothetical protein
MEKVGEVGVRARPTAAQHQAIQELRAFECDVLANGPACGVTYEVRPLNPQRVHQCDQVVRHMLRAEDHLVWRRPAHSAMIVKNHSKVFCESVNLPVPELCAATQARYQEKRKAFAFFLNVKLGISYIYHRQDLSPELTVITIAFICLELFSTSMPHLLPQARRTAANA